MAFFKLRLPGRFSSTPTGADALSNAPAESVEVIRKRARHRLMGSVVLVLGAVLGLPLLFDSQPRPVAIDTPIVIPDRNQVGALSSTVSNAKTGASKEGLVLDPALAGQSGAAKSALTNSAGLDPHEEVVTKDSKTEVKSEPKVETKPELKAEAKPEIKAEAKPEPKAEPKPETKPETKPEPKTEAKKDVKAEAKTDAKDGAKAKACWMAKIRPRPVKLFALLSRLAPTPIWPKPRRHVPSLKVLALKLTPKKSTPKTANAFVFEWALLRAKKKQTKQRKRFAN